MTTVNKKPLATEIDVAIQDQHTPVVDFLLINQEGTFTISSGVSVDDTTFSATGGHGISIGDIVEFYEDDMYMQAEVLNVVTNTITIDSPFDFAYTTSVNGFRGSQFLNVDGSSTAVTFRATPKSLRDEEQWDIVRMLIYVQDGSAMDDSLFGGASALTNGVVVRMKNAIIQNIFNVKTNGEWALRAFDANYTDRAPSGSFGQRIRRTFGGQEKTGVTIRLTAENDDEIQVIIQDDLTILEDFRVVAQGHKVLED